jgi:hypothetical protein
MKTTQGEDTLKKILDEIVDKINKQSSLKFKLNKTSGYFSIQVAERERYKNVVCFVKKEPVLSINVHANIKESFFQNPPYNKLTKRPFPPRGLQLRKESWAKYPHHVAYDLKEDKDVIFQLCKKACENFRR